MLLNDIKVKIDELNLTVNNEQQLQNPNKSVQNFSKSRLILDNMIENLREELAGISKTAIQEVNYILIYNLFLSHSF